MSSKYSIGEMNQLADALERAGFASSDVTRLKQFKDLSKIKQLLNGYAEIIPISHIVDCDMVPERHSDFLLRYQVAEHRKMGKVKLENRDGKLYVNGLEVIRFLSKEQKDQGIIEGNKIRQELASKVTLNVCILDYLLEHRELIPEEWEKGFTNLYFWGTIFHRRGSLFVPFLTWGGFNWNWSYHRLNGNWHSSDSAACLSD